MVSPVYKIMSDVSGHTPNLNSTIMELKEQMKITINEFARQRGLEKALTLSISRFSIFSLTAYLVAGSEICLPPLYFIKRADVPFTGPDDKNLEHKIKLQRFANHLADACGVSHQKVTWKDKMSFRLYLTAMNDIEKSSEALAFIVGHEMGHSYHSHRERKSIYVEKLSAPKYLILNVLTLGIFKRGALDLQSRKHEKQADAFGAEKYEKGGHYLFKTVKNFKSKWGREQLAYHLMCLSDFFSHGSYANRKERMKAKVKKLPL